MLALPPIFFALVLSIVDGDSVFIRTTVWQGQTVDISVRLAGIDSPELRGACPREKRLALQAKAALQRLLPVNSVVELRGVASDKYQGRVGGSLYTPNGASVGDHLIRIGLAKTYDGKKKRSWC